MGLVTYPLGSIGDTSIARVLLTTSFGAQFALLLTQPVYRLGRFPVLKSQTAASPVPDFPAAHCNWETGGQSAPSARLLLGNERNLFACRAT